MVSAVSLYKFSVIKLFKNDLIDMNSVAYMYRLATVVVKLLKRKKNGISIDVSVILRIHYIALMYRY